MNIIVKTMRGYSFRVNYGLSQKEYVNWKYNILMNFVRTMPKASGRCYYFRTITHSHFKFFRNCFYEGNSKRLSIDLVSQHLNPFILAVWMMVREMEINWGLIPKILLGKKISGCEKFYELNLELKQRSIEIKIDSEFVLNQKAWIC